MARGRVFYGWWVTIAFAVMVLLSTGVRFSVGPFLKPMVADLGTNRASYSLVVSLSLLLYGVFMPFVGQLVERWGARPVAVSGIVVFAASLAGTGLVTNLWQLTIVYGVLVALGLSATGHVVGSAVVSRWFIRRRATALSVLGAASMAGMSLLVPLAMWLILLMGWRATYALIGLGSAVILLPLALWVVRESPESMGLAPDGLPADSARPALAALEQTPVIEAVRTLPFWQLCGGMYTCGFSMSLLSAHGVPMLTDHGYHAMLASSALGVLGASSFGGALLFLAMFLVHDNPVGLLVIAALGGASMSGSLAMTSALTADIFGRFSVGSIFGTIFVVHQSGAALGSWLGGFLFEMTGGYGAAFALASVQLLVAAVVSLMLDETACSAGRLHPAPAER
jgi:MFS family permease